MKLWFCRSRSVAGFLIRLVTFCRWNHVAIEVDGMVYEASLPGGVQRLSAEGFANRWADAVAVDVPVTNKQALLWFLEQQVGKPYDLGALLTFPLGRNWQHPHKWFCAELAAKALTVAGLPAFFIAQHKVWPRDLWAIAPWMQKTSGMPESGVYS
ncbi:hypothetical protein [Marinobacter adhaerens]|uniref:hypothetical protein n=1 Tax=Marinobacter adhaerens TaxID=1033846 RepID=UPI003D27A149